MSKCSKSKNYRIFVAVKSKFSFILFLFVFGSLVAQDAPCGAEWLMERNAHLSKEQAEIEGLILEKEAELLAEPVLESRATMTIPVVVHVLYKGSLENISDEQIFSQIEILNQDYRRQNSDANQTPNDFLPVAADMEIEFCLAKRDPNGNNTTGITRTQTNFDNIGTLIAPDGRPRIYYSALGGKDAWNTTKYLNIWVAKIGSGLLGMASFPGAAPAAEDGVVIDPRYFGNKGWALLNEPHHLGRTCTHEVGHYLDLQHVWGPNENSCDDDDGVGDTPKQRDPYLGCPVHPQLSCGNRAMFMNYMDYTNDACQNLFTQGQKARAFATLLTVRNSLLNNNTVCTVKTNEPAVQTGELLIYPNPVSDVVFLKNGEDGSDIEGTVELFNAEAKTWSTHELTNGSLSIEHLPKGIYFLRFTETEKVLVGRFLKL